MPTELKVRAKETLYYIDSLRIPGKKGRNGEPQDEFFLQKKEDFNPQFMEPMNFQPELSDDQKAKVAEATKEDGSHRTAAEVMNIKSDELDESIRAARAEKVKTEHDEFSAVHKTKKKKEVL